MATTPLTSPVKPSTTPITPQGSLRHRNHTYSHSSGTATTDTSPTNSTLSDFATHAAPLRLGGDSRTALRNLTGLSSQNVFIRADPSLLTCFDPNDRELYDLWAPKR